MTSRIFTCPQCGNLGQHQELPTKTTVSLLDLVAVTDRPPSGWRMRAAFCRQCNTPFLQVWPSEIILPERLRLAGYPDVSPDLLPKEEGS